MKYDFTTMPDRSEKDALAVDAIGANVSWGTAPTAPKAGFSKIPMWVADMRFAKRYVLLSLFVLFRLIRCYGLPCKRSCRTSRMGIFNQGYREISKPQRRYNHPSNH